MGRDEQRRARGLWEHDAEMLRRVDAVLREAAVLAGERWACRAGRTDCCIGPFPINLLDARRLERGLRALEASDPQRAAALLARAHDTVERLRPDFPGDLAAGVLDDDEQRQEAFFERHGALPCPVLAPGAGTCELYEHRPWTCRTFGPPTRVGDEKLPQCPYCFAPCTDAEADAMRVEPDPEGVEDAILDALEREEGVTGETIVALALLGSPRGGAPPRRE